MEQIVRIDDHAVDPPFLLEDRLRRLIGPRASSRGRKVLDHRCSCSRVVHRAGPVPSPLSPTSWRTGILAGERHARYRLTLVTVPQMSSPDRASAVSCPTFEAG